mgnify:CR=1 FL=1
MLNETFSVIFKHRALHSLAFNRLQRSERQRHQITLPNRKPNFKHKWACLLRFSICFFWVFYLQLHQVHQDFFFAYKIFLKNCVFSPWIFMAKLAESNNVKLVLKKVVKLQKYLNDFFEKKMLKKMYRKLKVNKYEKQDWNFQFTARDKIET